MSFWLPAGLYIAVLLCNEYRSWPWLVAAAGTANAAFDVIHGTPPLATLLFVCANTVEAVVGAGLVRRYVARRPTMATLAELVGLLAFAAVLSTLLGACISATGQVWLGLSPSFVRSFRLWWGSTAMATLIVSPFVLSCSAEWPKWRAILRPRKKLFEAAMLFAGLIASTWWILVMGRGINSPNKTPFLIFLIWAGLRFGVRGVAAANLVLALCAGFLTQHYLKGLTSDDLASGGYVLTLQVSLAVATLVGLIPAIVLAEHARTLEELRKSEERFQLAVRGSTDGIWDWNILTNGVFYSDRYRELLGYAPAEFPNIFASFESVLHPEDTNRVLKSIETHLLRQSPLDVEYRLLTKAGDYRWFRGRGQAIWNAQGRPVRMAGSITEITERKLGEQLIRESEAKFSKAFRASPNGIAITELETGRFVEVNDSFGDIYGYTKEEMLGRTSLELGVFRSAGDREKFVAQVRAAGHIKDHELHMQTRNREARTLLVSAERIELGGVPCMVLVLFDITARLQVEERLEKTSRQLRALTSRLRSLQEEERTHLAREIHDHLGQLLTALSLDLRLIQRKAAGVGDPELRAALDGKITSARILADETITAVQKIATELRPAILDRLGLEAAIESETQAFQSRTGVDCHWSLPAEPLTLEPEQATTIFRVFQEILTNVARHAQASRVSVRLTRKGDEVILEVDDDGIGIRPGDIANPTSLGLLGMRERVAILGGQITFEPNYPRGTRVAVQIPVPTKAGQLA